MIRFSKLHGAGNDFVIINLLNNEIQDQDLPDLARKMCHRHFGIGADGLMAVKKSHIADVQMIYYNSDGSRGEMCGNGIRCFAKYVYENKITPKESFVIETLAGIKKVYLDIEDNQVKTVKVDMGSWYFQAEKIPVNTEKEMFLKESITVFNQDLEISCILMGVPHAVLFVDKINTMQTIKIGPEIENMAIFPKKINVNFVHVRDFTNIEVDTWERGAGKTLACGTGACASVIIANQIGLVGNAVDVFVEGGKLKIFITEDKRVLMEGNAVLICTGDF